MKIAVRFDTEKDPAGQVTVSATLAARAFFEAGVNPRKLDTECRTGEEEYGRLLETLRPLITQLKERATRSTAKLYWQVGSELLGFHTVVEKGSLVVEGLLQSVARDTGMSRDVLWRCERLVRVFPDGASIEEGKTAAEYLRTFDSGYKRDSAPRKSVAV